MTLLVAEIVGLATLLVAEIVDLATLLVAEIVDLATLLKVVIASLVVGVGVTIAFSLALLGGTRFTDLRRDDHRRRATAFAVLGVLAAAVTVASVVVGMIVMTT
jgi:hypothetical protein